MIIVVIIFSLIYVILLTLILKAYYRDNVDLEKRILELEKRTNIEDRRLDVLDVLEFRVSDLDIRERTFIIKEDENNTQKECDSNMACGRRGRPRGSRNTGGRRK